MNTPHRADSVSPLARQALGRPLTRGETDLAAALESIFAQGIHEFDAVAQQLRIGEVPRPSGSTESWTAAALEEELRAINTSLDAAYEQAGTPGVSNQGCHHG